MLKLFCIGLGELRGGGRSTTRRAMGDNHRCISIS
jgi:hypothetical protein